MEIDLTGHESEYREAFYQQTGARTTPRIFIHGKLIGGADDLEKLSANGQLWNQLNTDSHTTEHNKTASLISVSTKKE